MILGFTGWGRINGYRGDIKDNLEAILFLDSRFAVLYFYLKRYGWYNHRLTFRILSWDVVICLLNKQSLVRVQQEKYDLSLVGRLLLLMFNELVYFYFYISKSRSEILVANWPHQSSWHFYSADNVSRLTFNWGKYMLISLILMKMVSCILLFSVAI